MMANPGNRGVNFPEQQGRTGTQGGTRQEGGGVMESLKEKASDVASTVASTAEGAWDATKHAAQSVASTAEDAWDSVNSFMRRYPMATFCIGAGFGFLVAQLFTSRRS
jgi:ElaB/YqjD/DUF883 family membrane-anchored ribosome-binding protein